MRNASRKACILTAYGHIKALIALWKSAAKAARARLDLEEYGKKDRDFFNRNGYGFDYRHGGYAAVRGEAKGTGRVRKPHG